MRRSSVSVKAGGNLNIGSAEQASEAVYGIAGKIVFGTACVLVGTIVSRVVEVSVEKIYTSISDFINGGVPLD